MLPPDRPFERQRSRLNSENMNNENILNGYSRNYRESSFDIAPARLGSVGPGEESPRRQRSERKYERGIMFSSLLMVT